MTKVRELLSILNEKKKKPESELEDEFGELLKIFKQGNYASDSPEMKMVQKLQKQLTTILKGK